jgi:hypothetical protein
MIVLDPVSVFAAGVFVSSSVLENDYPLYNAGTTYAAGARVIDPSNPLIYESIAGGNVGQALTNQTKWLLIGYTNRWKMFDQYNNTQTQNANSIVVVLSPKIISQGLYLGGLDANEVNVTVTDAVEGVVRDETQSLIVSDSGSSYFNWGFKPIYRKSYFVTALLPVYANATVQITITKAGSTAKCAVCCLGPLMDAGLSQYGLSTEIKDYSSTTFNFDGTSNSVVRGYSKRMGVDVQLKNELIDAVQERLATDFRQKQVVWIGTTLYGSAILFGKYSSFKNVIADVVTSRMALQIEGTI